MKTDPATPKRVAAPTEEHLRQLDLEAVECISFGTPCEVSASTLVRLVDATRRANEYEAFFREHGDEIREYLSFSSATRQHVALSALAALLERLK